jgi:hypothetical protein
MADMEVLRLARGYRTRHYIVPETGENPVLAYNQLEYQVRVEPGSYFWGLSFSAPAAINGDLEDAEQYFHIQITDACTETALFSDYVRGTTLTPQLEAGFRHPMLIEPRLVGNPGQLNVEIYNRYSADLLCQLVLFIAEPMLPPDQLEKELQKRGIA